MVWKCSLKVTIETPIVGSHVTSAPNYDALTMHNVINIRLLKK